MITFEEAEQIALAKWNTPEYLSKYPDNPRVIIKDKTIEKPYGWIFFISCERFQKYGETDGLLPIGAGPIVVDREGRFYQLGTGHPLEIRIAIFEEWLANNQESKDS